VYSFPTEVQGDAAFDVANRKAIPPFAALRAFEAVGRLGGVRRAAQSLGLDHAVVSRHIRSLETWTGIRLIERLHAGGRLTAEGAAYHTRIASALAEIAGATADLTRSNQQTQLNIWCIPGFASQWLLSRLGDYRRAYPGYEVEIHPTDAGPDFALHQADGDLRFVPIGAAGKTKVGANSVEIARPQVFPVASPSLLARLKPIVEPEDLLSAPLLHEDSQEEWRAWLSANRIETERALPGPRLWHAHLTLAAAARGEGIALANPFLLGDDLATGRLVEINVGRPVVLGAYTFFGRKDRWDGPAMSKFRRWLARQASTRLEAA
jgi:DNA-binding transcriptional LysR family regulator